MRYTAFFDWPSTLGTEIHTIREPKTTKQAPFSENCSHLLNIAIETDDNFNWSATFRTEICLFMEPKTTKQAPFSDSRFHLLFLFYRLGLYLFSTATFNKT